MGISSDGIVFYGMCSKEDRGVLTELAEALGLDDHYDLEKELEKRFGVTLGIHCSFDCPMYYLAMQTTKYKAGENLLKEAFGDKTPHATASRGYPEAFNPEVDPEWGEKITEAAEWMGWSEDERKLGWWVTSLYG